MTARSVVESVGQELVEVEVRGGLGVARVEGGGLVEVELGLGRPSGGGDGGWPVGEVQVQEDPLDDGGVGEEREWKRTWPLPAGSSLRTPSVART
jgi:hypothetical protein